LCKVLIKKGGDERMPKSFERCVAEGGRVRTVKGKRFGLKENEYRHICFKDGKSFMGEVKKKEKK